jgi:5-oxoprolinase (ATP-hydrolysing)
MTQRDRAWEFWIDRGGTFTDIIAKCPDGTLTVSKLLSENPEHYDDAAIAGIERILAAHGGGQIAAVKMGTTVATNALLERKGEPTVLAITKGLGDALRIGTQARPKLFARNIVLPETLYGRAVAIAERLAPDGEVLIPLDEGMARSDLTAAFKDGYRAIAIVLMHGYRFPAHEQRVAAIAREIGFTQISVSHEISGLINFTGRGDTTVADAYLSPVLYRHIGRLGARLGGAKLYFMQSAGGLASASAFRGKDAILSGPAGGVAGMAAAATEAGFSRVIGFDMGGTSTDVSHYAGHFDRTLETSIAGVRLRTPMLDIHTIAAGGGSICRFDGQRLRVGPQSAGAVPGPACYRRGGPLTITDCNVMLGKLRPEFFPKVFGPRADESIDVGAVKEKFATLANEIASSTGQAAKPEEIAEGFIAIAVETMAKAIKQISIQRGHDLVLYALNCFGGAAGQHACLVANALGIDTVIIHPLAGVLSAYGIGLADMRIVRERTVGIALGEAGAVIVDCERLLGSEATKALVAQGVKMEAISCMATAELRYEGVDATLTIALGTETAMCAAFEATHKARFGFVSEGKTLIVESIAVEAVGHSDGAGATAVPSRSHKANAILARVRARMDSREWDVAVYDREGITAGTIVEGPAIIREATATTIVEPGWRACMDARGNLILERATPRPARIAAGTKADPTRLELFNNLFMATAEEMGLALQNTASSVNIKERLDFSCALFDLNGALVANAPHIPVHLGSMGDSVRTIIQTRGEARDGRGICAGDVYVLNAPYRGGTHLPDVTVIAPVFDSGGDILGYTAARGHQADIGGITPGSMPPLSRTVDDEGVLIDNFLLVDQGVFREGAIRDLLASGSYPARNIDQNIADLKAQIAACAKGATELNALTALYGKETVRAFMGHVRANAAESVRRAISSLRDGKFRVEMDNGAQISVSITVDHNARAATIDFTGTSPQGDHNFNAPLSVCRAAVLYVFRTLIDDDIPLNEGCLDPLNLIVPEGSLLNPRYPAAVVAGNVETSQAITDALYGALGIMAAAQGTMNNFTFGDGAHQYYETVCGGAGAGPDFDGASAVHTHMTNTRLTDPEILETRFPVLVEEFSIRKSSGGAGAHKGGDGVLRKIRFRKAMTAAILSNRRRVAPFGLQGGEDGARGANRVERKNGGLETLSSTAIVAMEAGDAFVLETPGGGGFGKPKARR